MLVPLCAPREQGQPQISGLASFQVGTAVLPCASCSCWMLRSCLLSCILKARHSMTARQARTAAVQIGKRILTALLETP